MPAAQAQPGVQLITVEYTATSSVAAPELDEAAARSLISRLELQVRSRAIGGDNRTVQATFAEALAADPLRYYLPSQKMFTKKMTTSEVGTGWVVTPDGYLVTAAHVVGSATDELKRQFVDEW